MGVPLGGGARGWGGGGEEREGGGVCGGGGGAGSFPQNMASQYLFGQNGTLHNILIIRLSNSETD